MWSKTSLTTMFPRVQGDTISSGTRNPMPMGASSSVCTLEFTSPSTLAVDRPTSADMGGVGAQAWS